MSLVSCSERAASSCLLYTEDEEQIEATVMGRAENMTINQLMGPCGPSGRSAFTHALEYNHWQVLSMIVDKMDPEHFEQGDENNITPLVELGHCDHISLDILDKILLKAPEEAWIIRDLGGGIVFQHVLSSHNPTIATRALQAVPKHLVRCEPEWMYYADAAMEFV